MNFKKIYFLLYFITPGLRAMEQSHKSAFKPFIKKEVTLPNFRQFIGEIQEPSIEESVRVSQEEKRQTLPSLQVALGAYASRANLATPMGSATQSQALLVTQISPIIEQKHQEKAQEFSPVIINYNETESTSATIYSNNYSTPALTQFSCYYCNAVFLNRDDFFRHTKQHRVDKNNKYYDVCKTCLKPLANNTYYKHARNTQICLQCGQKFCSKTLLNKHRVKEHNKISCKICHRIYTAYTIQHQHHCPQCK